jgi:hypothetical protein
MNKDEAELRERFAKLPKLKHMAVALLEFAQSVQENIGVMKDEDGCFRVGYVAFGFPSDRELIRLYVNVDLLKPPPDLMLYPQALKLRSGHPFPFCDIEKVWQLYHAAVYIAEAYGQVLGTRITYPPGEHPSAN